MSSPLFYLRDIAPSGDSPFPSLEYGLPADSSIVLEMYDMAGEKVRTLYDGLQKAGAHRVEIAAGNFRLPGGTYFCRMAAFDASDKMQYVNVHKLTILS